MAGDNSGGNDRIDVRDDQAFALAENELGGVAGGFHDGMGQAGQDSASPAAAGGTNESKVFMQQERQAREMLVQFMTKTSNGLDGYHGAATQLKNAHQGLVHVNNTRLKALLRPTDGPVRSDPAFDWHQAVTHQLHPEIGGH
jgi:hypothetical protein